MFDCIRTCSVLLVLTSVGSTFTRLGCSKHYIIPFSKYLQVTYTAGTSISTITYAFCTYAPDIYMCGSDNRTDDFHISVKFYISLYVSCSMYVLYRKSINIV